MATPAIKKDNVIPLEVINGKIAEKKPKVKKDGTPKRTKPGRKKGEAEEVLPIKTKDDISAIMDVLNYNVQIAIEEYDKAAADLDTLKSSKGRIKERVRVLSKTLRAKAAKLYYAYRNRLLWVVGINCGLRASDLRLLRWGDFFKWDSKAGELVRRDSHRFQPIKTKDKYVKISWNNTIWYGIEQYMERYPVTRDDLDKFVFATVNDNTPMSVQQIWNVVCDTADAAQIPYNVGTHTLRKTWGYWSWRAAKDKTRALVELQHAFNHTSTLVTMHYIGLLQEDVDALYKRTNLGLDDLQKSEV